MGMKVRVGTLKLLIENAMLDPGELRKYISTPNNPAYAIRFVDNPGHVPDASRAGNHNTVINGVYAFIATTPVIEDIIAALEGNEEWDYSSGLFVYLEDILAGNFFFVLKNEAKKAQTVKDQERWKKIERWVTSYGSVETQQNYINKGWDAIIDPHDIIDRCGVAPQICFLTNEAFSIVEGPIEVEDT